MWVDMKCTGRMISIRLLICNFFGMQPVVGLAALPLR